MVYEIKIINIPPVKVQSGTPSISPSPTYIPNDCVGQYISDVSRSDDGFVSIPLYKRNQYANVPQNSVLTIYTEDSAEMIYYKQLIVDGCSIDVSDSGNEEGGGSKYDDVVFYDYDGTVVKSYSAEDFINLSSMPENPTHGGLTSQGWNWTFSDARDYVLENGKLNVGQMYITDDGKTRLYITLTSGRTSPVLELYLNDDSELDIDWGDETTHSTFSTTEAGFLSERHEYTSSGSYVISISVVSGSFELKSSYTKNQSASILSDNGGNMYTPDSCYLNSIKHIRIGSSMESIGDYAISGCYSLKSITIPKEVQSIGKSAFRLCYSLISITLPENVPHVGEYTFSSCYSLESVVLPNSITDIGLMSFSACSSLNSITFPSNVSLNGTNTFLGCSSLTSVVFPYGITSICESCFSSCFSFVSVVVPSSVTTIGKNAFEGCMSLAAITINKESESISGSPWGATTGSPTNTQIIWNGD